MFRISINRVLFNTFGETLSLMPQLFKRFLLNFKWFLCVLLYYNKNLLFLHLQKTIVFMYNSTALAVQWYCTLSRSSSFVGLKLKIFCLCFIHLLRTVVTCSNSLKCEQFAVVYLFGSHSFWMQIRIPRATHIHHVKGTVCILWQHS